MEQESIIYTFTFPDGDHRRFVLTFEPRQFNIIGDERPDPPHWTELPFFQCPQCPLNKDSDPHCPLALHMIPIIEFAKNLVSYEKVHLRVETAERTYSMDTTLQRGISSLMGLIMPASGCPKLAVFKPMARFHLPQSSRRETVYRVVSMYLMAQYFHKNDERINTDFEDLKSIYGHLHEMNEFIVNRLRAACEKDSSVNAVIILDSFTLLLPMEIDDSLKDLKITFKPLVQALYELGEHQSDD